MTEGELILLGMFVGVIVMVGLLIAPDFDLFIDKDKDDE